MGKKKTYIIAEVGPNHNGSYKLASKYIEELSKTGVNAVKFQIGNPKQVLSLNALKIPYGKKSKNYKSNQDATKEAEWRQLTYQEHKKLSKRCKSLGIDYLCSAFDIESLRFLNEELDIKSFKIPSGEILSLDLLEYINNQKKPVILSTGMSTFEEIKKSLFYLKKIKKNISLLHCVSNYPTNIQEVNLAVMLELKKKFKLPVGFSDHTIGNVASMAAVSLGAEIIEKHVTLNKNMIGPDHHFSANIKEFIHLIKNIRSTEMTIGFKNKKISSKEKAISKIARKSIVSRRNLYPGDKIKLSDICFKRPGTGFLPIEKHKVLGKKVKKYIKQDTLIQKKSIS